MCDTGLTWVLRGKLNEKIYRCKSALAHNNDLSFYLNYYPNGFDCAEYSSIYLVLPELTPKVFLSFRFFVIDGNGIKHYSRVANRVMSSDYNRWGFRYFHRAEFMRKCAERSDSEDILTIGVDIMKKRILDTTIDKFGWVECALCYTRAAPYANSCGHTCCNRCWDKILGGHSKTCPFCREDVTEKSIHRIFL
jgi:hypothetical protein